MPVAVLSASAAIIGLVGQADTGEKKQIEPRAILFGIACGLFVAAVSGIIFLIVAFFVHAQLREEFEDDERFFEKEHRSALRRRAESTTKELEDTRARLGRVESDLEAALDTLSVKRSIMRVSAEADLPEWI